jgi:hypothetical protein
MTRHVPNGDRIPTPALVVCLDADNAPMPRVSLADAGTLCTRGWAEWVGTGTRRHLRLTAAAPVRALSPLCRVGTRPVRGDRSCSVYGDGQLMGASKSHREFFPLS